ncbi:hypothetical protein BCR39DRAFT_542613 [Naematelia encephala]|uniref:Uncharacterized protein n=1 Tax=Naematelia encephala TaxID=71784 RepID=A0A1Y2ATL5_9TREE|nr:hypothetical protein BCR39DRAFT_542613 [Naematelia encephala]
MSSNASTSIPGTSPGEKEDNTQPDSSSARTEEENSEVPTIKSSEAKTSSSHIIMLAAEMKQAISRFLTEADFNNFASTSQIIRSAIKTDDRLSVVFGGTSGVQESDLPSLNENAPRVSHLHLKAIHRLKELPYFPNLDTFHVMKSASPNNEDWSASASDVVRPDRLCDVQETGIV